MEKTKEEKEQDNLITKNLILRFFILLMCYLASKF
jgi:hypothetical protein